MIENYIFYVGSVKQASDFDVASKFIINHIKKTFERGNNIAESLCPLTKIETSQWNPRLKSKAQEDVATRDQENKEFKLIYKVELNEALQQKGMYEENKFKAYALLWECCTK
eukprot:6919164-Ditylum_brightwellii.AAC.1